MKVTIIGTGYVGISTAACLAYIGHDVACIDTDAKKVAALQKGKAPIYEPYLEDIMEECSSRLSYTTSYPDGMQDTDVVFLAVGTPPLSDGSPDLQYLRAAAMTVAQHLPDRFVVIVNKSTVPVGSGNWVQSIITDANPSGDFCVASNPEFLREGSALHDSLYADRIVVGADQQRGLERLYQLYRPILDQSFTAPRELPRPAGRSSVPMIQTDLTSSELIKYAANAFLALKISYINEIGRLASRVGADIQDVARGIGLDQRIGPRFLNAGLGWGGSCFGKDTAALIASASEYGLAMPIVQAGREANYRQRGLVVDQLLSHLKILKGRTIGLLGLAFKPETDDLRDAPALDIARRLIERGAKVRAHDPVAMENARAQFGGSGIAWSDTVEELARDADALVLVTEWQQYRDLDWKSLAGLMRNTPLLLDGRLALDGKAIREAGWHYVPVT
jgi:UDPglucose 6-dehydrogenase